MEITLTIDKEKVMEQVAATTAYTGAKMDTDPTAFNRISTVDEDENQMERFWEESRADISQELIGLVTFEGMVETTLNPVNPDFPIVGPSVPDTPIQRAPSTLPGGILASKPQYQLRLDVSKSFDNALLPSMKLSLFNYFVQSIVAKWYVYTNKQEAGDYADKAVTLLDDIHRKAVYKKRPTRPTYDD